ncbi:MAG: hypothetical protein U0794_08550 [Isosphaeraceae bacterium]
MSQVTASPNSTEHAQLEKLCVAIRGKLQFMDYLVRAALADVDRFLDESDAGTRIFIRQLIEMHASNLASECDNMRLINDFCASLSDTLNAAPAPRHDGDEA